MKPPLNPEEVHLRDYLYILRKRRFIIIFFALLVLAAGIMFTLNEKVLYRATTTILIEKENPNIVNFKEVMQLDTASSDYYQTQYQILKSRSLIEALIQEEQLEKDPFLAGSRQGGLRQWLMRLQRRFSGFFPEWFDSFLMRPSLYTVFIKSMLEIEPLRNSRLVKVSVVHPKPVMAAQLANQLVELYVRRNLEDRYAISERASNLLSKELTELKARVVQAERELQQYKELHGLVNIPSIREKDEFIQDARLELVKLQAEEAKLSKRYLPAHPKMISLRSQIAGLAEQIQVQESKTLDLSRVAIEYSQLEREAETARRIYESLLERLEQTQTEAQTQSSNIMVVDEAVPPVKPFKPRPFLNLAVALFAGLVGGVLLAFFVEYLDPTVRIPDDVEKGLGLHVFGIIPRVIRAWKRGPAKGELMFTSKGHSAVSESFRAMRTALLVKLRHIAGCRTILVTSANPSEGKSTVSLNLAAAFQQNNLRVLLVDGDLRKPRLHKLFDLPADGGLADILEQGKTLTKTVHENAGGLGFDFLSCGSHSEKPTEILGSEKMQAALKVIKKAYDIVIIDSPPFMAVADVAVMNEWADAMIVIARYQKTHRRHLKDVRRNFSGDGKKILGVVINQVSVREKDYYYNQYYYYGYGDARGSR